MSNVPADLTYTKSHEWLRTLADGVVEIGITDHAQQALGDLVFVEVPEAGRSVHPGHCHIIPIADPGNRCFQVSGRLAGIPRRVGCRNRQTEAAHGR